MKLYRPVDYLQLTKECEVNGAGPKGFDWIVPDYIWGVCITEAANIHDAMYYAGKSFADRKFADHIFEENMQRLIDGKTCRGPKFYQRWLKRRRYKLAHIYYVAVRDFGKGPFLDGKDPNAVKAMGNEVTYDMEMTGDYKA